MAPISFKSQQGFSLLAVMALALLVTTAAFAVLRLFQHEAKIMVSTDVRDRLESALDQGLEKALYKLNTPTGWTSTASATYFSSLTVTGTAFVDLPGYQYWVKVLPGLRVQATQNLNDTIASALTNTADLNLNRTVLVRALNTKSGKELKAMATVHRSEVSTVIPVGGIYTNGYLDNGGWPGSSYNSCTGSRTSQTPGCNGSVISGGGINPSGSFCIPQVTVGPTPQPYPAVAAPLTWTVEPWPFGGTPLASITSSYTAPNGSGTIAYSVTRTMNVQVNSVNLKNKLHNIDTNGFPVNIYVTGTLGMAGNGGLTTRGPNPGGAPADLWIYVVGNGNVGLSGTGTYECVIIAPQSTVTLNGGGTGSFSGAIVANTFNKNGSSGNFYFDECILAKYKSDTYSRPPIVTMSWSQL